MGIHDRPYMKDDRRPGYGPSGGHGGFTLGMPRPGKAVKYLLMLNVGVFVVQVLLYTAGKAQLGAYLGVTVSGFWQVWRYLTFQFLHSTGNLFHLGLNMLGLYMLGTPLEQHWGTKRFLRFYLSCGVAAGAVYVVLFRALMPPELWGIPLIGASGGVYGILLAAAVLFPHFRLILFLFPVPIRLAAVIVFGGMGLFMLTSLRGGEGVFAPGFWSHAAHLGGAVAAAVWIWLVPRFRGAGQRTRLKIDQGAWQRKMKRRADDEAEIDRLLQKIHERGINGLSRKERRKLQAATKRQQQEDRNLYRL